MVGLNLLVGKRDADLPLACHSALFRNRPQIAAQEYLSAVEELIEGGEVREIEVIV